MIAFDLAASLMIRTFRTTREKMVEHYVGAEGKKLFETYNQKAISTDSSEEYQKEALLVTQYPTIILVPTVSLALISGILMAAFRLNFFAEAFKVTGGLAAGAIFTGVLWMSSGWYGYYRMKRFKKKADKRGKPLTFKTHWFSKPSDVWAALGVAIFFLVAF